MAVWSEINFADIDLSDRFDAEYFQPSFLEVATALEGRGMKLGELGRITCSAFYPAATHLYETGETPFIRCVDVIEHPVMVRQQLYERIPDSFVREHRSIKTVETDEIVITKVGTPCFAGIVHESLGYAALSRTVLGITKIDKQLVDPYYLTVFLRCKYGFYQLMRERELLIQLQLTLDRVGRVNVFLPPFGTQVEIGNMLREHYSLLQEAKSLFRQAEYLLVNELDLDRINNIPQRAYEAYFSDVMASGRFDAESFQPKYAEIQTHLTENFKSMTLGEMGYVLRGRNPTKYVDTGIPVIRSGDLIDINDLSQVLYADPEERLFFLERGDVCISSIGFGSIGKVQVFDTDIKAATVSEVTIVRQTQVNPYYLQIFLQSEVGQLQIERRITGATGQLHLYPRDVEGIIVPILSKAIQDEIDALVRQSLSKREHANYALEQAKQRVEELIEGEG